ncbi:MAG: hypothetical protein AVDCRST_MAG70-2395 [uncultured Thermomicrobiales bacterium]|uniref:Uncharacterized protein n=1 Tax=uncultured Thermomicrobiales bacterium TaxID=1645740 RepID=A0A6J4VAA7_9BACT|nr:MAG: hypothetical protein AVDCRST_MAG70-2395 [uncultured Thermomicrobiales bacterium]
MLTFGGMHPVSSFAGRGVVAHVWSRRVVRHEEVEGCRG